MTARTKDECIAAAGQVYAAILTDPERAAQLREHRAKNSRGRQAGTPDAPAGRGPQTKTG